MRSVIVQSFVFRRLKFILKPNLNFSSVVTLTRGVRTSMADQENIIVEYRKKAKLSVNPRDVLLNYLLLLHLYFLVKYVNIIYHVSL